MGRVVDSETQRTTNVNVSNVSIPTLHPVVEFEVEGKTFRIISETGASWETLRVGQIVEVQYNPHNPNDASIEAAELQSVEALLVLFIPLVGGGIIIWGLINLLN